MHSLGVWASTAERENATETRQDEGRLEITRELVEKELSKYVGSLVEQASS